MSIIHLIVFVLQFFLFVPLFFFFFKKSPKDSKNRKIFLIIALVSICYASVDAYFHRYLIMSDFYYAQGEWRKSGEIAEKGLNSLEDKSKFYDFVYGRYSLYRKMKRAEEKVKAPERNVPAGNQEVTAIQEIIEQNEPAVNEEVTAEQEAVEQEDSVVDEEVSAEQEAVEENEPDGNEEAAAEQEGTDEAEPEENAAE